MGHFEKSFYHVRDDTLILDLLKPKKGQVRAVLDTDTYNEIDDQFALVQMMLSKERIKDKDSLILVLAWNFFDEIKKNNKDLSNNFINIKELENKNEAN